MRTALSLSRTAWPLIVGGVVFCTAPTTMWAQRPDSTVVVGHVTSAGGVAISAAVVAVPRLRLSTTSNDAGVYRLIVRGAVGTSDTLRVTRLGYPPVLLPAPFP